MAFKKYEAKSTSGRQNTYLTRNRFPMCWIGKSTITFNRAACELFGDGTDRVEVLWDSEERMFAFVPAPYGTRASMKLTKEMKDERSGVKRIAATGIIKAFPELNALHGRAWRIMPDQSEGYFAARFATQKELSDYDPVES